MMQKYLLLYTLLSSVLFSHMSLAADITVSTGQTVTTTQSITNNGDTITIEKGGRIETNAVSTDGSTTSGNSSTILNLGTISTHQTTSDAIRSTGTHNHLINRGKIQTIGDSSEGIWSNGSDNQLVNESSISTKGQNADAILATNDRSIIINSGHIETSGDQSEGLSIRGSNSQIHNSGSIHLSGDNAHGIQSTGNNSLISHSGILKVTGQNTIGINVTGADSKININGQIAAIDQATTALYARNNPILTFQSQSQIIGQIDVDATSQISVESYQAAPSTNLTIPNHGSLNIEGSHPILKQGNQVHRADSSGFVAQRLALAATSQTVHNHITTRLNRAPRLRPVQVASTRITPDLLTPSPQSAVWGGFIGGYQQMDQSRDLLAYQKTSYGLITGYDMPVEDHRLGFNLAFVNDSMQTNDRSIESDSKNLSTGVYGNFSLGKWQIAPALMLGYQFQENRRTIIDNLNGIETATSAQHNFSLSPALTVSRPLTLDQDGRYQLRPLAQIAYHYGYFGGYTETGTSSSNLKIEGSSAHALKTRLQLSLDHQFGTYLQGGFSVRSGLDHHYRSADKINLSLGTARTRFDPTGKTLQMSGFVGLNLYYDVIDGLTVAGDVEVNRANNSGTYYQAALTAKWVF